VRSGKRSLRHGSLFSGIGGFDLAAEWMGWKNIFHCELNPFCQRVLAYHYPRAKSYDDIKKTDFSPYRGKIDILTGGFPCQPYSVAGKRLGRDDDRHLWPDMLRAVREIRPTWVVAENVLGIVNWSGGVVFEEVCADLEAEGYSVQPYVLPAAGVGAPHRRERVWFIAHSNTDGGPHKEHNGGELQEKEREPGDSGDNGTIANPGSVGRHDGRHHREERCFQGNEGPSEESQPERQERQRGASEAGKAITNADCGNVQDQRHDPEGNGKKNRRQKTGGPEHGALHDHWGNWPTQSPICNGDDGVSLGLDGITFPKWRIESIKAGGNAIVPQVALQIFKAIQRMTEMYECSGRL